MHMTCMVMAGEKKITLKGKLRVFLATDVGVLKTKLTTIGRHKLRLYSLSIRLAVLISIIR